MAGTREVWAGVLDDADFIVATALRNLGHGYIIGSRDMS